MSHVVKGANTSLHPSLGELASMFSGVEGMPKAQIEQRVRNALKWLADKPQHQRITADLELVEINLKNLK